MMNSSIAVPFALAILTALVANVRSQEVIEAPNAGSSKWGVADQRGATNLITPEKVLEATSLIRSGKVYQLGRIFEPGMPMPEWRRFDVTTSAPRRGGGKNDFTWIEVLVTSEIGQVGTQLDGLGDSGIGDTYYNGNKLSEILTPGGLTKLGIENAGVFVTRGLLLDIASLKQVDRLDVGYEITPNDLQQTLAVQELTIRPGDAVLIHTGWGDLWMVDNELYASGEPGLGIPAARFLASQQISLVGVDNWAIDVLPSPDPELVFPAHQILITLNGIYNLENINTSELARDRVYEFAFFLAPIRLKGVPTSPANPIAIN